MIIGNTEISTRTNTINILMIDTSLVFLEALPLALHRFAFLKLIGRANTIEDGIALLRESKPDIALIEGALYRRDFRLIAAQLQIRLGESRVALFADQLTDANLEIGVQNRVQGFLSTQDSTAELADHLQQIAAGRIAISKQFDSRLKLRGSGQLAVTCRSDLGDLTNRQLEVLTHLAAGLRVKEIAQQLHLSVKAVESHKFRIMRRLKIRDRVQLCRWAIREGLIEA